MFWKVATGVLALATIAAVVFGARFFMEREELAEALDLAEQQETSLARLEALRMMDPSSLIVVGFRAEYNPTRSFKEQICATFTFRDGTQEACLMYWGMSDTVQRNALRCAQRLELLKPLPACFLSPIVTDID